MKRTAGTEEVPETAADAEVTDEGAVAPETPAEADMPAAGGSYVRQKDGTLKRED